MEQKREQDLGKRRTERSDEELALSAAKCSDSTAELISRYMKLIWVKANTMANAVVDAEDLAQEGMLGLLAAIRGFQSGKETSFRTYAEICVRSRLYAAVRAAQRVLRTDAIPASPSAGAALHAAAQLIANGKSRSALAVFSARQNIL